MSKNFYITTTLPYVNADPHVGFALEIVQADALARWHALLGDTVFFNTGTDEHGVKIYRKAAEQGKDTQEYTDEYAEKFRALKEKLNLFADIHFIRTTDDHHKAAAQEFWRRCLSAGDIYKKNYQVKYCVGCELEKTDSELVEGKCPLHPTTEIELIDEENYFFKFSKYQKPLLELYEKNPTFVLPASRMNEIRAFVERGLEDFSVSRLKSKMPWGVPVPDDETQVMYVWFDALANYISTLGWPEDEKKFVAFWGTEENPNALQIAGKDNLRQQSAMWQAMLMSANLPSSKQILIHGFITSGGQKMSKSLGNVVNPVSIIDEYGTDALRFFLLRHIPTFEDGDFTMEQFARAYNADLANGLGNLVSRIMKMAATNLPGPVDISVSKTFTIEFTELLESYEIKHALDFVWAEIEDIDGEIARTEPFKLVKSDPEKGKEIIGTLVVRLYGVARLLAPFLPTTSEVIIDLVEKHKTPTTPIFPRKESAV